MPERRIKPAHDLQDHYDASHGRGQDGFSPEEALPVGVCSDPRVTTYLVSSTLDTPTRLVRSPGTSVDPRIRVRAAEAFADDGVILSTYHEACAVLESLADGTEENPHVLGAKLTKSLADAARAGYGGGLRVGRDPNTTNIIYVVDSGVKHFDPSSAEIPTGYTAHAQLGHDIVDHAVRTLKGVIRRRPGNNNRTPVRVVGVTNGQQSSQRRMGDLLHRITEADPKIEVSSLVVARRRN